MNATMRCPCGSNDTYDECCGRLHSGAVAAPTAEMLMRSRFSAFALADADRPLTAYLLGTWHRSTRPRRVEPDERIRWTRLEIVDVVAGGLFDRTGVVEFRAHHRSETGRGVQHERSQFVRAAGRWFYLRGEDVTPPGPPGQRVDVGRAPE